MDNTHPTVFDVRSHGATGDGRTRDTGAIQKAIDLCAESGGGTVLLPPGVYLSGTLHLKSNVALHVEAGATLLASPDPADYDTSRNLPGDVGYAIEKVSNAHFIHAVDVENIAITGRGTIDGNGRAFFGPAPEGTRRPIFSIPGWRPGQLIALSRCRDVLVRDVTIVDSPYWTIWPFGCERVRVDGITVRNDRRNPNGDGINPDCCRDVRISNCRFETGDDCIALRSHTQMLGDADAACEDVVVSNCVLTSPCCCVRLGYAGDGPIRRCAFSNLVMSNSRTGINMIVPRVPDYGIDRGARIEDITFSNLVMDTRQAFYLWVGDDVAAPAGIRNIHISNVLATTHRGCHIGGNPRVPVENVTISNMRLTVHGEMDDGLIGGVPYPMSVWGIHDSRGLPHALYCRHVRGLELSGVRIEWGDVSGPWLKALRGEYVEGVTLRGITATAAPGASGPAVELTDAEGTFIDAPTCR